MSDVVLYPIRGQVAQVNGKNEFIVYVPRADKYTHGVVKIGDGILVDDGTISFDTTQIKIEHIAKNGVDILPDENKRINIVLDKTDVGLDQVDNTSDVDKPISKATQQALDSASNRIETVSNSLETHKNDANNPHKVTKTQVGLSKVDNTSDLEKPVSTATSAELKKITNRVSELSADVTRFEDLVKGVGQAVAYASYSELVGALNTAADNKYKVGQAIYINDKKVPDVWVYAISGTSVNYVYESDEAIIEALDTTGTVQFGYYKLAPMETKSIDIENYVRLDNQQTITGLKLFKHRLGVLNEIGDKVLYIEHDDDGVNMVNNDGENFLVLDSSAKTLKAFDKILATEDFVTGNSVSYLVEQDLTDEEKERARNNIGAGTGAEVDYATKEIAGILRVATDEEASTGSFDLVAVTPSQMKAAIDTSVGAVESWLEDINTGSGV